jgi:hypothetical protein
MTNPRFCVKTIFVWIVVLLWGPLAFSFEGNDTPPIALPVGAYSFQGRLIPKLFRKTKTFDHNNEEDVQTIRSLKSKGYLCFRRNPRETLCQVKTSNFELPSGSVEKTHGQLDSLPITFSENPVVEFTHDGSTTKEWLVRGPVKIGPRKIEVYRISKTHEGDIALAFPVDGENPISFLNYHGDLGLGFSLILQGKDSEGWTLNYLFDALYQPTVL